MPSFSLEDDDPVVASYNVYITNPLSKSSEVSEQPQNASRLFVLQYPSHRPLSKPYNAARSQKPAQLRLKPNTGMVEVEVPILTTEHFNAQAGMKYGEALSESRVSHMGGSYGLAGGFTTGQASAPNISLNDIPAHGEAKRDVLDTQTLGGKIAVASERDPVYMLGSFQKGNLHLTHLDAVVQMRPQLHHIDAEEEAQQKKTQSSTTPAGKMKSGFEAPSKLESKAIELKMKDNKEDPKDRSLKTNARLLRDIQADQWRSHEWVDEDDEDAWLKAAAHTTLHSAQDDPNAAKQLKSAIPNDEWLDKMSVAREDGKKGLRAKLKGRDRERARRKKVENERRQMNAEGQNNAAQISDDSDLTSLSEHSDTEKANADASVEDINIKKEVEGTSAAPAVVSGVPDAIPVGSAVKKRGRPKKS